MNIIYEFIKEIIFFFNEISVYLLFGFLMAGVLHVLFPESIVRKHLGRNSFGSVVKATLFGIPLPLCSCGVIPVATSLQKSGASKGSIVSFLITTPQIGADSFMITYSLIGWIFAIFRIVASAITALLAGIFINIFNKNEKKSEVQPPANLTAKNGYKERIKTIFSYIEFELLGSIINALMVGILIAGCIAVLIPEGFFEKYLSSQYLSMILMLIVGIPMYVCASASTPIAASLLMKGISPGAALIFLLTGPATNAANISTVIKIVGKKSTAIYLAAISLVSLGLGVLLNTVSAKIGIEKIVTQHHHDFLPGWLKVVGSFVLLGMISGYYFQNIILNRQKKTFRSDSKTTKLSVRGMTCQHCVITVKKAVESIDGTENVAVDLSSGTVEFELEDSNSLAKVKKQIDIAGYEV